MWCFNSVWYLVKFTKFVFPMNQNRILSEIYLNGENYQTMIDGDEFKCKILNYLPDKNS